MSLEEAISAVTDAAKGQAGVDESLGGWAGLNSWQIKELAAVEERIRGETSSNLQRMIAESTVC